MSLKSCLEACMFCSLTVSLLPSIDTFALTQAKQQKDLGTKTAAELLEEATQLFGKGELSSAESILKKVLVLDKHNADAYFDLGAIAEARADLDVAIENFKHCLQERPDDKEAQEALASLKVRRLQFEEKAVDLVKQNKPAGPIDFPLAQNNIRPGKTYGTRIPHFAASMFFDATSATGLAIVPIYWHDYRAGGVLGRWISKTYPGFVRASYDHQVALLALDNSNGWTSNNPLGIKADAPLPEELADGDYKVVISAIGDVRGLENLSDDSKIEAVREFVRKGGYLVVSGYDLRMVPILVPEVISCYSSQPWNNKSTVGLCVDAELTKAAAPLAKGLSDNSRWCIPLRCPMLKILDPSRVSALAVSQFVKAREPEGGGVLAALIPYGKGYILCYAGTIYPLNAEYVPDNDSKMHIPLGEGLVVNFMVSGLRAIPIQSAANQS